VVRDLLGVEDEGGVVKRTSTNHKRLALEPERVRNLVVELTPAELRRVAGGGGGSTEQTTTTTQVFAPTTTC
jgi:hypothetical protein